MQTSPTFALLVLVLVFIMGFFSHYLWPTSGISDITSTFKLSVDRSDAYQVQVLPDLGDQALASLPGTSYSYLAMIDAGSSGCRAHVYRYGKLRSLDGPLYVLPQHESKKVKPGLSSFAKTPSLAGASIAGLVDFIKEQVPPSQWSTTPIWLKATAGIRMIEYHQAEAILESVRDFLENKKNSPFLFRRSFVKVISGNEEGGFGWIAFNYLKRIIGPKPPASGEREEPYTVVEMGGASSQVSQLAPTKADALLIPKENQFSFEIEGRSYMLYTHSYLGYGAEQAREGLNKMVTADAKSLDEEVADPCLYTGYERDGATTARSSVYEGTAGNFKVKGSAGETAGVCATKLAALFVSEDPLCKVKVPTSSFNCVYQPRFVVESKNFLAFENFFYVSSAVGVSEVDEHGAVVPAVAGAPRYPLHTTPHEFQAAATTVCSKSWTDMQSQYPLDKQDKDNNNKWCFSSSFAYSFLIDGLGVESTKRITIQKEVDGSEIEWALGAAYKETADLLKRTNLRPT